MKFKYFADGTDDTLIEVSKKFEKKFFDTKSWLDKAQKSYNNTNDGSPEQTRAWGKLNKANTRYELYKTQLNELKGKPVLQRAKAIHGKSLLKGRFTKAKKRRDNAFLAFCVVALVAAVAAVATVVVTGGAVLLPFAIIGGVIIAATSFDIGLVFREKKLNRETEMNIIAEENKTQAQPANELENISKNTNNLSVRNEEKEEEKKEEEEQVIGLYDPFPSFTNKTGENHGVITYEKELAAEEKLEEEKSSSTSEEKSMNPNSENYFADKEAALEAAKAEIEAAVEALEAAEATATGATAKAVELAKIVEAEEGKASGATVDALEKAQARYEVAATKATVKVTEALETVKTAEVEEVKASEATVDAALVKSTAQAEAQAEIEEVETEVKEVTKVAQELAEVAEKAAKLAEKAKIQVTKTVEAAKAKKEAAEKAIEVAEKATKVAQEAKAAATEKAQEAQVKAVRAKEEAEKIVKALNLVKAKKVGKVAAEEKIKEVQAKAAIAKEAAEKAEKAKTEKAKEVETKSYALSVRLEARANSESYISPINLAREKRLKRMKREPKKRNLEPKTKARTLVTI